MEPTWMDRTKFCKPYVPPQDKYLKKSQIYRRLIKQTLSTGEYDSTEICQDTTFGDEFKSSPLSSHVPNKGHCFKSGFLQVFYSLSLLPLYSLLVLEPNHYAQQRIYTDYVHLKYMHKTNVIKYVLTWVLCGIANVFN